MNILNKLHTEKELCRFITCGNVDDGKSTLIGRMLYDSSMVLEDQLNSLMKDSKNYGTLNGEIDFALLVDGLESEREQGITIDVAYRYFSTEKRKFIIADTPGHEQYTKNMATGASTADIAIILIDAQKGVMQQTKRHSYIASLLGIKQFIIAINKMDLLNYDENVFSDICKKYQEILPCLKHNINVSFIPISALKGENIVNKSPNMSWYKGKTLFELLNTLELYKANDSDFLLPVQYVSRPNSNFRGFCGSVISGKIKINDEIVVLPSNKQTTIKSIIQAQTMKEEEQANYLDPITLVTKDEIDISRGNIIASKQNKVKITDSFLATVIWMNEAKMQLSNRYLLKLANNITPIKFDQIEYKKDINTLSDTACDELCLNDIALCKIDLEEKIAVKTYEQNKTLGSFIIIDRYTNQTLAAGMIEKISSTSKNYKQYSKAEIELNNYIREFYPEWGCKKI